MPLVVSRSKKTLWARSNHGSCLYKIGSIFIEHQVKILLPPTEHWLFFKALPAHFPNGNLDSVVVSVREILAKTIRRTAFYL